LQRLNDDRGMSSRDHWDHAEVVTRPQSGKLLLEIGFVFSKINAKLPLDDDEQLVFLASWLSQKLPSVTHANVGCLRELLELILR